MREKIFKCIETVFHSMDESGLLNMPDNLSEKTVLMGENEVLDSVAFISFFIDLEEQVRKVLGVDISISMEDVQERKLMDYLDVDNLISVIEEKCRV